MALPLSGSEVMDLTPDTSVIRYMRQQNLTWAQALKELIDNAIDQGATEIWITLQPPRVCQIMDNGLGCPHLKTMLRLGEHLNQGTTRIGTYGVGLKDAAVWMAKSLEIRTIHEGIERQLRMDWEVLEHQRHWAFEHRIVAHTTADQAGTCLTFRGLYHRRIDYQRLSEELGRTYTPWLSETGNHLWLKTGHEREFTALMPFVFPQLRDAETATFVLDGKTARVTLGLVPPDLHLARIARACGLAEVAGVRGADDFRPLRVQHHR